MAGPRRALPLALLLLGCAAEPRDDAAAMERAFASARAGLVPAPLPAAPSPAILPRAGAPAPLPAAMPRARGAGAPSTAAALVGSRAEEMRRMMGEPALRRAEGEAEIWLYEAPDCRLDVVLYPAAGALSVAHAAARAHGTAAVTEAACLAAVARAPAGSGRT